MEKLTKKQMRTIKAYQPINAGNDVNGNPRVIHVLYDKDFETIGFVKGHHSGSVFRYAIEELTGKFPKRLQTVYTRTVRELKVMAYGLTEYENI